MIMKKFKVFSAAFAVALMLGSCSTNDDVVNGGSTENNQSNNQYIAVNIVNASDASTRATSKDDFVYGDSNENEVKDLRFYLFDGDGEPYKFNTVTSGKVNYYDAQSPEIKDANPSNDNQDPNNVEKIKQAILVLNGQREDQPKYVVAVANKSDLNLGDDSKKLDDLKNLSAAIDVKSKSGYVMTNSVYAKADGTEMYATEIPAEAVSTSKETAEKNAVDIYIERVLAKVSSTLGSDFDGNGYYKTQVNEININGGVEATPIYVKITGAMVANEASQSYALKKINYTTWSDKTNGLNWEWNEADRFRSYWATSVSEGQGSVNSYSWKTIDSNKFSAIYTQENTPTTNPTNLKNNNCTKIVIAAQMFTKGENDTYTAVPVLYQYLGSYYNSDDALFAYIIKKCNEEGLKKFTDNGNVELSKADFVFSYSTAANTVTGLNDYEAKIQLKSDVKVVASDGTTDKTSDLNNSLEVNKVKIWKDGKGYYYTTIAHLATSGLGQYGIVRNHVYQISINSIKGLPTPVPDPDKPIIPDTPADEDSYMYASVKILSWRVVKSGADFEGK